MTDRLPITSLHKKTCSASEAASLIQDGSTVACSGFTKTGYSKAVLPALCKQKDRFQRGITLYSGASLGEDLDGLLAESGIVKKRLPFQADKAMRAAINNGTVFYQDQHLSETADQLFCRNLERPNVAVIEIAGITADGLLIPGASVGNDCVFVQLAETVILEINEALPLNLKGLHDCVDHAISPSRKPLLLENCRSRIGEVGIRLDLSKIQAIVFTNHKDEPAETEERDTCSEAIAKHLLKFLNQEVASGKMGPNLRPLQAGIGKIADAVLGGLSASNFENLELYSEVLQDSTLDLIDVGKVSFASGSAITLSEAHQERFLQNLAHYKKFLILRPQHITNAAEFIHRMGVIALNTAVEFDLYGNVNSSHLSGTHILNGIGGSDEFARNASLSVFVSHAVSKGTTISHVVPYVSHCDHTEHDVDILVTDQGLADLRGCSPRERAERIIENCVHPIYKAQLRDYFERAKVRGGHTPHLLEEAFSWHIRLAKTGTMLD
jgi:acetyl-CoA hydrolase/succinyl-CoA:acetate CoA-transferase